MSFQIQILRSWGWDLTMLDGQRKSTIVASVVCAFFPVQAELRVYSIALTFGEITGW